MANYDYWLIKAPIQTYSTIRSLKALKGLNESLNQSFSTFRRLRELFETSFTEFEHLAKLLDSVI